MQQYAFYGSLRRGMENFEQFRHGLRFRFQTVIAGYRLHAMSHYPYAVYTGREEDKMTVEIFEITNAGVEKEIHALETRVGYILDTVSIEGVPTGIYLFPQAGPEPLVQEGDWVKFFGH